MTFRGALAGSVSLAALVAAAPVFAADAPEIVIVTGIRASMDRAIDIKRDSIGLVDAVSAEDIGKFSDKNVADALQRIPGVNTVSAASGEGGFDENDRVSIRGTNASLTQTLVDGCSVATAYTTLRGPTTPQVNGLFNWKNDAGTFGIMIQGFYEARNIRRDGQEFLGYSAVAPTDAAAIAHPALAGALYPTLIGSALFLQQRVREGGNVTLEYSPNDSFDIRVQGFYSHLSASNVNNNYMFWGTNEFSTGQNVPTSWTIKDNIITAAAFPQKAGVAPMVTDFIQRPGGGAETWYLNGQGDWKPNNDLTFGFKAGYSHGVGKTNPQVAWEGEIAPGPGAAASYDFTKGVAVVNVPGID